MTDAQLMKFYLPAWNRAWDSLWMKDGRNIVAKPGRVESERLDQVETCACALARKDGGRAMRREDLRHAANFVATAKTSSKAMNNTEINKAVALLELLVDPSSLNASMKLMNPEIAQRRALEAQLREHPHAYVAAISAQIFGKRNWLDLSFPQIQKLAITLRHRAPVHLPTHTLPPSRAQRQTEHQPV
jgi:hypothetical protein